MDWIEANWWVLALIIGNFVLVLILISAVGITIYLCLKLKYNKNRVYSLKSGKCGRTEIFGDDTSISIKRSKMPAIGNKTSKMPAIGNKTGGNQEYDYAMNMWSGNVVPKY